MQKTDRSTGLLNYLVLIFCTKILHRRNKEQLKVFVIELEDFNLNEELIFEDASKININPIHLNSDLLI